MQSCSSGLLGVSNHFGPLGADLFEQQDRFRAGGDSSIPEKKQQCEEARADLIKCFHSEQIPFDDDNVLRYSESRQIPRHQHQQACCLHSPECCCPRLSGYGSLHLAVLPFISQCGVISFRS